MECWRMKNRSHAWDGLTRLRPEGIYQGAFTSFYHIEIIYSGLRLAWFYVCECVFYFCIKKIKSRFVRFRSMKNIVPHWKFIFHIFSSIDYLFTFSFPNIVHMHCFFLKNRSLFNFLFYNKVYSIKTFCMKITKR